MKTTKRGANFSHNLNCILARAFVVAGFLFCANVSRAQIPDADALSAIEATDPVSADSLPLVGTFYSAANPAMPPMPGDINGLPAWPLGGNVYLLDDLDYFSGGGMHAMDDSGGPGFDYGDDYDYPPYFNDYSLLTNGLWLEITNVSNGQAYLNLHNATDYVYEVWSKTDLAAPCWNIETEVFPTDINCMPFTVPELNRTNLFFWARDWTGITSDGNETPEWWFWEYFGTVDMADADLDANGNTLLSDYTNNYVPSAFSFSSIEVTNDYVNSSSVSAQLDVTGYPYYMAVLVDFANFTTTNWTAYTSSNITVNLGTTEGSHDVWIGLRGHADDISAAQWHWTRLILDTVPPVLTITNPTAGTVSQPMIQVQGFANETLSSLTFDVSNAAGLFTNQTGYTTGQFYDTNLLQLTTNWFQCYDVALTNGLNIISVHAFDLAGNETTTNLNYTLDYSGDTNPPALTILWPQSGTEISGSSFTLQAQVDDDTATVTASIVDTNGDTNTVQGLVERSGLILADNLPLGGGTNTVTLTATNAAGNSTVTNFIVIGNDVGLTMNPLTQLNQSSVTVTGTIGDSSYTVTVNGVAATVSGDPTWEADYVPVNESGTASIYIEVHDSSGNLLATQTFTQSQPAEVGMMSYSYQNAANEDTRGLTGAMILTAVGQTVGWSYASGGLESATVSTNIYSSGGALLESISSDSTSVLPAGDGFGEFWEDNSISGPIYAGEDEYSTQTGLMIKPSDEVPAGTEVLYLVQAQINGEDLYTGREWAVDPTSVSINGTPTVDAGDGYTSDMLLTAPSDVKVPLFITSSETKDIDKNSTYVQTAQLQIFDANTGTNLTLQTNTVIVGQQMNLQCQLNFTVPPSWVFTNFQWTVPGFAISSFVVAADSSSAVVVTNFPLNNSNVVFYWVDGASNRTVQCSATVNGKTVTGQATFNVLRPTATVTTQTGSVAADNFLGELVFENTNTFAPGIIFSSTMTIPSGFSGTNEWVQVDSNPVRKYQSTNSTWWVYTENGTGPYLDTTYPYQTFFAANMPADNPNLPFQNHSQVVASDSMEMWLMFKPTGGQWVPLRAVNWSWSGSATNNTGTWTLESGSTHSVNPSSFDTTTYPQWNNNVTDAVFQQQ